MQRPELPTSLGSGLWRRSDPDLHQALARLAIVAGALWFSFSGYYAVHAPDATAILLSKWVALVAGVVSVLMVLSILRWPGKFLARRLIGISHDIIANSIAMYLGGAVTSFFAVIYVVIILASGVRFGRGYLGYAALCSLACFGSLHALSPYWRADHALSLNVVLVLTVVPAYMYRLIRSREQSRAELERRATHDSLTGLMNRAGFEQQLEESRRAGSPGPGADLSSTWTASRPSTTRPATPRATGCWAKWRASCANACAPRTSAVASAVTRSACSCAIARRRSGMQIATRIKERIHDHRMHWCGSEYSVGASIGVVSSRSIEDGPSFLRLADAACYAAKNAGRNHIHMVDTARMHMDTGRIRALGRAE